MKVTLSLEENNCFTTQRFAVAEGSLPYSQEPTTLPILSHPPNYISLISTLVLSSGVLCHYGMARTKVAHEGNVL
jgi:hypothetical protein